MQYELSGGEEIKGFTLGGPSISDGEESDDACGSSAKVWGGAVWHIGTEMRDVTVQLGNDDHALVWQFRLPEQSEVNSDPLATLLANVIEEVASLAYSAGYQAARRKVFDAV